MPNGWRENGLKSGCRSALVVEFGDMLVMKALH